MQQAHYKMKKLIMKANNFNTTTPKKKDIKMTIHIKKILKTTFLNHKDRKKKKPYQTAKRHAQKDERKKNNKH